MEEEGGGGGVSMDQAKCHTVRNWINYPQFLACTSYMSLEFVANNSRAETWCLTSTETIEAY